MSHPDPNGPPDLTPIQIGEVWENPATGERATILELPWTNPEGRMVAELTALVGARVFGEHRHPTVVERFTALQDELTVKRDGQTSILREGETAVVDPGGGTTGGTPATRTPGCAYRPHRASAGFTRSRFCGASDASATPTPRHAESPAARAVRARVQRRRGVPSSATRDPRCNLRCARSHRALARLSGDLPAALAHPACATGVKSA
jgi:hypothetical protein